VGRGDASFPDSQFKGKRDRVGKSQDVGTGPQEETEHGTGWEAESRSAFDGSAQSQIPLMLGGEREILARGMVVPAGGRGPEGTLDGLGIPPQILAVESNKEKGAQNIDLSRPVDLSRDGRECALKGDRLMGLRGENRMSASLRIEGSLAGGHFGWRYIQTKKAFRGDDA